MSTTYRSSTAYRASIPYQGAVAQYAVPISDTVVGTWITAPLYAKIDETTASDADSITSATKPEASTCKVKLSNLTDPNMSTGHIVRYRYQKDAAAGQAIALTIKLMQASTIIAQHTDSNISNGWTTSSFTLTSGEANSITDYTDLYLQFEATGS